MLRLRLRQLHQRGVAVHRRPVLHGHQRRPRCGAGAVEFSLLQRVQPHQPGRQRRRRRRQSARVAHRRPWRPRRPPLSPTVRLCVCVLVCRLCCTGFVVCFFLLLLKVRQHLVGACFGRVHQRLLLRSEAARDGAVPAAAAGAAASAPGAVGHIRVPVGQLAGGLPSRHRRAKPGTVKMEHAVPRPPTGLL